MRVAVIGAGWAGLAAAVELSQAGLRPHVFEAARSVGGRARTVELPHPDGQMLQLDNGQHILIGAYTQSLRLMRVVGVDPETALHRSPLQLRFYDGTGLQFADGAAPWDALMGIVRARGWTVRDKTALLLSATLWGMRGFRCAAHTTVAQLCASLTQRLRDEFIDPLCISALNTPAHEASGQVFLRVLRDSLLGGRGSSNFLLPRTDLGACFAQAAAHWLQARGVPIHTSTRVHQLYAQGPQWGVRGDGIAWDVGAPFDAVVVATNSTEAVRLLHHVAPTQWLTAAKALRFYPITTVYALLADAKAAVLPSAIVALRPQPGQPAQFVFDRGQLGGPAGVLAFVISASDGSRAALEAQVLHQAHAQLGLRGMRVLKTIVEKRATFACIAGLQRPVAALASGLWAAGDYMDGPYPATLEGAVRSGCASAHAILNPGF